MNTKLLIFGALFISLAGFSTQVAAAPGFVARSVNLRAGPGPQYPAIERLGAGAGVNITGCVADWRWCDVNAGGMRGWISGRYLNANYKDRRMGVNVGPAIGLPIVVFNQDQYWGDNYRNQAFYRTYRPHGGPASPAQPTSGPLHGGPNPNHDGLHAQNNMPDRGQMDDRAGRNDHGQYRPED